MAALSTITVTPREKPRTPVRTGQFMEEMGDTGNAAINSFLAAARLPVLLLIWILAHSPVWIPVAIAYRYIAPANPKRVAANEICKWQRTRGASEGAKP